MRTIFEYEGEHFELKDPPLKCDGCGRFVSYASLENKKSSRRLLTPDSHFTREEYETLCQKCIEK